MIPSTPSEVHGRVYSRAIEPLAHAGVETELDDLCSDLLESLLVPADLHNYPTMFGPEDDDPLFALLQRTKNQNPLNIKETPALSGGKDALRGAYKDMKRYEARTISDRFTAEEEDPYPLVARPMGTILSAKAIREAATIGDAVRTPPSIQSLFLPNSRHFCSGYLTVEDFKIEKVNPEEALNLKWKLDEPLNHQVKSAVTKVNANCKSNLDAIWARWEKLCGDIDEETKIMPSPPLFPVPTASAWSYDQVTKLVTNSKLATIVNREASVTPNTFIRDTIEQNEGNGELDPFSYNLLTEFDGGFEPLSPSSAARSRRDDPPPLFLGPPLLQSKDKDDAPLTAWRHSDASRPRLDPLSDFEENEVLEDDERPRKKLASMSYFDEEDMLPHAPEYPSSEWYGHMRAGENHWRGLPEEDRYDRDGESDSELMDEDSEPEGYSERHTHMSYPSEGTTRYPSSFHDSYARGSQSEFDDESNFQVPEQWIPLATSGPINSRSQDGSERGYGGTPNGPPRTPARHQGGPSQSHKLHTPAGRPSVASYNLMRGSSHHPGSHPSTPDPRVHWPHQHFNISAPNPDSPMGWQQDYHSHDLFQQNEIRSASHQGAVAPTVFHHPLSLLRPASGSFQSTLPAPKSLGSSRSDVRTPGVPTGSDSGRFPGPRPTSGAFQSPRQAHQSGSSSSSHARTPSAPLTHSQHPDTLTGNRTPVNPVPTDHGSGTSASTHLPTPPGSSVAAFSPTHQSSSSSAAHHSVARLARFTSQPDNPRF